MVELKTKPTDASVEEFLEALDHPTRKADGLALLEIMKEVTQEKPVMWGTSIIGFGTYHYKYASDREADWLKVGFSPRKRSLTVYLAPGLNDIEDLKETLEKAPTKYILTESTILPSLILWLFARICG